MESIHDTPERGSRAAHQPLSVLAIDDALLKMKTVVAVTGLSRTSVDRKVQQGAFPKPVKLGPRCSRWKSQDVRKWLASQAKA